MENSEKDYELVLRCKRFMDYYDNPSVGYLYNPFTQRKVKRGSSKWSTLHTQVKKYLEDLVEEEFHSPLKIEELFVDAVVFE